MRMRKVYEGNLDKEGTIWLGKERERVALRNEQ